MKIEDKNAVLGIAASLDARIKELSTQEGADAFVSSLTAAYESLSADGQKQGMDIEMGRMLEEDTPALSKTAHAKPSMRDFLAVQLMALNRIGRDKCVEHEIKQLIEAEARLRFEFPEVFEGHSK